MQGRGWPLAAGLGAGEGAMEIDFREMVWFVGVTMAINCLVFVFCGALELVERFGWFQDAKIQQKVNNHVS